MNRQSTQQKTPAYDIPTLEIVSPEYAELTKKRRDLIDLQSTLQKEHDDLFAKIATANKLGKKIITEEDIRIGALLGPDISGLPASSGPTVPIQADHRRIAELTVQLDDCRKAIPMLDAPIASARKAASQKICDQFSGLHKELLKDIAEKLLQLHDASAAYQDFLGALLQKDVAAAYIRPNPPFFLGGHKEQWGVVATYLRELIQSDIIPGSAMPMSFR